LSLGKKYISKNVSIKAQTSSKESYRLLNSFLKLISQKSDKNIIKISNFGTFANSVTPERIGRNPKTKKEYIVTARNKVKFSASKNIRLLLN